MENNFPILLTQNFPFTVNEKCLLLKWNHVDKTFNGLTFHIFLKEFSHNIFLLQEEQAAAYHHQRSRSALVPSPTSRLLASNHNLLAAISPSAAAAAMELPPHYGGIHGEMAAVDDNISDPARQLYGSTSFIYRLISSNGSTGGSTPPPPS